MKTCLVTGGSGFTGRYLIALLKRQGHRVVALASQPCGADETHHVDLNDEASLVDVIQEIAPEEVYHLAALSFVGHPTPLDFYRVNTLGTDVLFKALSKLIQPPRVLVASSANVYGANAQAIIDENVTPLPVNHYAHSKLAMEHVATTYAQRMPLLIARPFNYTGRGQALHFLVPKIVQHIKNLESVIELGNVHVSRDFSDVRDVCNAYTCLLHQWPSESQSGDIVNIGSGRAVSLKGLIDDLQSISGHEIKVMVNQDFVRSNEISELKACTSRLDRWAPGLSRVPLKQTLEWMLSS
ncbi:MULTISPECIES: NAD-dependent epimerase/dehydratase family protein [unclassified Halomonas]|uniref:NAD-dependent epimerase/dehydratase family protein n=1 Tax=unclassified Halomonas TaxID=2609666 RepID=UPI0020768A9F|nr:MULTISPECIES: NAD-dependent epimerase/dehydratase family protein [unclassified Halomonas]